jgi:hypothetical protein
MLSCEPAHSRSPAATVSILSATAYAESAGPAALLFTILPDCCWSLSNIMRAPSLEGRRAVMFVCGDDAGHKPTVLKLASDLGFEAIDVGGLAIARLLEP